MIVLSVGFVTNTLDTPSVIRAKAQQGEKITIVYVYGAVWITLGIAGTVFQWWQKKKSDAQAENAAHSGKGLKDSEEPHL